MGKYPPLAIPIQLWLTGTNDFAYPLDSVQKSYQAVSGPTDTTIIFEMAHGHVAGWERPEIAAFTDTLFKDSCPLTKVCSCDLKDGILTATFKTERPLIRAELLYTRGRGMWQDRRFNVLEAGIEGDVVTAKLPKHTSVAFLNIYDDRKLICSTPHETIE